VQPPQHLPLPKRRGQNEDPVGKHAKAAKAADVKAAKAAKVSKKRQEESDAKAAKEKLAEMEVDESFAQREEVQQRIRQQSDIKKVEASKSDDEYTEFPGLANVGVSDDDTEGHSDTLNDDQGLPQQKKSTVSVH